VNNGKPARKSGKFAKADKEKEENKEMPLLDQKQPPISFWVSNSYPSSFAK